MSFSSKVDCTTEVDGTTRAVEIEIEQEYSGISAEVIISFAWPDVITGFPTVVVSDSGSGVSLNSRAELIAIHVGNHFGTNATAETNVRCKAHQLEIRHGTPPAPTDRVDVHFYLANFPVFVRVAPMQVTGDGLQVEFQHHNHDKINRRAIISGIRFDQVAQVKDLVRNLCWLASLAAGSYVTAPRIEILFNGILAATSLEDTDLSMSDVGKPLVHDNMSPGVLQSFMEQSLVHIRAVAGDHNVYNLIHVGLLAKHNHYLQVKALLMADFLEILRFGFASNVGVRSGIFSVRGIDFYWTPATTLTGKASFEEILQRFCTHCNLTSWDSDFKNLRNEIMHTGDFHGPHKYSRYQKLHHFCDRVLLALLEWDRVHGSYVPFDNPTLLTPNITSTNRVTFVR